MERPKHYGKWGQRGKLEQEPQRKGCCRWCGDPLTGRRTSYCSDKCKEETWLRIVWSALRDHIIARDKMCRLCDGASYKANSFDTWALAHDYGNRSYKPMEFDGPGVRVEPEWHVDHIKPIAEGGTDDPANLRLLCGRCHKRVTKEWHGERAAARRPQQRLAI